jgi:hypothetical protein
LGLSDQHLALSVASPSRRCGLGSLPGLGLYPSGRPRAALAATNSPACPPPASTWG